MPNIQHHAVYTRNAVPLISCFRRAIPKNALRDSLFDATEEELLSRSNCVRHESFVGSYLLGLELSEGRFPRCATLLQCLRSVVVDPLEALMSVELSFSFIKYATGMAPSSTEGVFAALLCQTALKSRPLSFLAAVRKASAGFVFGPAWSRMWA